LLFSLNQSSKLIPVSTRWLVIAVAAEAVVTVVVEDVGEDVVGVGLQVPTPHLWAEVVGGKCSLEQSIIELPLSVPWSSSAPISIQKYLGILRASPLDQPSDPGLEPLDFILSSTTLGCFRKPYTIHRRDGQISHEVCTKWKLAGVGIMRLIWRSS